MFRKLKNIRPGPLITHLIVTLAYPAVRAFTAPEDRLLRFANAVTIVGLILLVVGVVYSMNLHGDFDISRYYIQRGMRSTFRFYTPKRGEMLDSKEGPAEFLNDLKEKRANAFNYPLFLGIIYVLVSVVLVYGFLERPF